MPTGIVLRSTAGIGVERWRSLRPGVDAEHRCRCGQPALCGRGRVRSAASAAPGSVPRDDEPARGDRDVIERGPHARRSRWPAASPGVVAGLGLVGGVDHGHPPAHEMGDPRAVAPRVDRHPAVQEDDDRTRMERAARRAKIAAPSAPLPTFTRSAPAGTKSVREPGLGFGLRRERRAELLGRRRGERGAGGAAAGSGAGAGERTAGSAPGRRPPVRDSSAGVGSTVGRCRRRRRRARPRRARRSRSPRARTPRRSAIALAAGLSPSQAPVSAARAPARRARDTRGDRSVRGVVHSEHRRQA